MKLTNLPFGTTPIDLKEILQQFKAKTCFIPRTRFSKYDCRRFAYITFETDDDLEKVCESASFLYGGIELRWEEELTKTCHKCGSASHLVTNCNEREKANSAKERKKSFFSVYNKFKVPNYKRFNQT
jgi:RNA recognition motif-containing protein